MIMDALNLFSDSQDVHTATVISSNVLDLGESRNIGVGENLYLSITVDEAVTKTADLPGTGTITPTILVDDDVAFGTATTIITLPALSSTSTIGKKYFYRIPSDGELLTDSRYMAVYYTKAGTVDTGHVTTALVHGIDCATMFPNNYTIS